MEAGCEQLSCPSCNGSRVSTNGAANVSVGCVYVCGRMKKGRGVRGALGAGWGAGRVLAEHIFFIWRSDSGRGGVWQNRMKKGRGIRRALRAGWGAGYVFAKHTVFVLSVGYLSTSVSASL